MVASIPYYLQTLADGRTRVHFVLSDPDIDLAPVLCRGASFDLTLAKGGLTTEFTSPQPSQVAQAIAVRLERRRALGSSSGALQDWLR